MVDVGFVVLDVFVRLVGWVDLWCERKWWRHCIATTVIFGCQRRAAPDDPEGGLGFSILNDRHFDR